MRPLLFALALVTLPLSMVLPAYAQMQDPILSLPDGQVILNISATEYKEVEQDLLVGSLSKIVFNVKAGEVQNEINKSMAAALKEGEAYKSVKLNTGTYQVYEYTDPRTKESKWRGEQNLTIKSKNAEELLELTGKLQDMGLTMRGLSYMLAPDTSVAVQDSLMEAALTQLQNRADRAAKALGKSSAELRDVHVQGNSGVSYARPQMMRAEMTMAADSMAAPVAAAGEDTITLNVSARAILKP